MIQPPLEPTKTANKYFCRQPGGTALEVELPRPGMKAAKSELVSIDMKGALGIALPAKYVSEGVIESSQSGTNTGGTNEREWFGEDRSGWLGIIISGLVGLVGGVLLQIL